MTHLWPFSTIEAAEHVVDDEGWCWCQPRVEHVLPFDEITVHRHFWDRPEYGDQDIATQEET
jgi:hypothetical protein